MLLEEGSSSTLKVSSPQFSTPVELTKNFTEEQEHCIDGVQHKAGEGNAVIITTICNHHKGSSDHSNKADSQ